MLFFLYIYIIWFIFFAACSRSSAVQPVSRSCSASDQMTDVTWHGGFALGWGKPDVCFRWIPLSGAAGMPIHPDRLEMHWKWGKHLPFLRSICRKMSFETWVAIWDLAADLWPPFMKHQAKGCLFYWYEKSRWKVGVELQKIFAQAVKDSHYNTVELCGHMYMLYIWIEELMQMQVQS